MAKIRRINGKVRGFPDSMSDAEIVAVARKSDVNYQAQAQQISLLKEMKATFERAIDAIKDVSTEVNVSPEAPNVSVAAPDMSEVVKVLQEGFEVQKVILGSLKPSTVDTQPIVDAITQPIDFEADVLSRDHMGRIKKMRIKGD